MFDWFVTYVTFVLTVGLYFTPTFVGMVRGKRNIGTVVVVNALLGWTVIGWVVALAMAFGAREAVRHA